MLATLSNHSEYLTAAELAARWKNQVNPKTLANWRSRGFGPEFVRIGNRILYRLSAIEAYERKNEHSRTAGR